MKKKFQLKDKGLHVVPVDDKFPHRPSGRCCNAFYDENTNIWTHHSFDKREQFERQGIYGKNWAVRVEYSGELMDIVEKTANK